MLEKINKPNDIHKIALADFPQLAEEIRQFLIESVSHTGGHLASNLGVVELTMALHNVLEFPEDKIVWDVGHQAYTHKILTGRKEGFTNPAKYHTYTGYTAPEESGHDLFKVGHTSTSVSLACGVAKARDLKGEKGNVIALIGDGSLSGGEALEGLDNAADLNSNIIIVVNDNEMSIAENHGGLYKNLQELRETNGKSENTDIIAYDFTVKLKEDKNNKAYISISEKGGHVVFMNYNRDVNAETITQEKADEFGKKFLKDKGFDNMKETYYLKESGIVTINYAYEQDGVTIYSDLIKLKVALDNGEVLGIETKGYLNSHEERNIQQAKISKEQAKENLNPKLQIESEALAIIPTKWRTERLCWEFKGKVDDTDFLVYINAETGKEEDILVIVNTPNGTLTH